LIGRRSQAFEQFHLPFRVIRTRGRQSGWTGLHPIAGRTSRPTEARPSRRKRLRKSALAFGCHEQVDDSEKVWQLPSASPKWVPELDYLRIDSPLLIVSCDPGGVSDPRPADAQRAAELDGPDSGGDPVCWAHRVCPECGLFVPVEPPTICPRCNAVIGIE